MEGGGEGLGGLHKAGSHHGAEHRTPLPPNLQREGYCDLCLFPYGACCLHGFLAVGTRLLVCSGLFHPSLEQLGGSL